MMNDKSKAKRIGGFWKRAFTFTSAEPFRPALNGVLLERMGDGMRVVATDGVRLFKTEVPDAAAYGVTFGGDCAILGRTALPVLQLGTAVIHVDSARRALVNGSTMHAVDERFPDYTRVIPDVADLQACALVDVAAWREAVAAPVQKWSPDEKANALVMGCKPAKLGWLPRKGDVDRLFGVAVDGAAGFRGMLAVKHEAATADAVFGEVELGEFPTQKTGVALDWRYLVDACADDEDALLLWSDSFSPVVLHREAVATGCAETHVIMPVRI